MSKKLLGVAVKIVIFTGLILGLNSTFAFAATGINQQITYQGKLLSSSGSAISDGEQNFVFSLYNVSSGGSPLYTETWNSSTRFSSIVSSGTATSGTSIVYAQDSSENNLQVGDTLYDNTNNDEAIIQAIDIGTNTITITPAGRTWATSDVITTKVSTRNGFFSVRIGSISSLSAFNFNQTTLYLGVTVGSDSEMTPRELITSVPFAFNSGMLNGFVATSTPTNGQILALGGGTANTILHGGTTPTYSAVDLSSDTSGVLSIAKGGTGASTSISAFNALSPMTNIGDLIYGGLGGFATVLAAPGVDGNFLQISGGVPTWGSALDLNNSATQTVAGPVTFSQIPFLPNTVPTNDNQAVRKGYVDTLAQGLATVKQSVIVATVVAGTLATSFENGDTIDGVVLSTGDRILIKNQASDVENGIYTVNASGAPTRASDFNSNSNVQTGNFVAVINGTVNANTQWVLTSTNIDVGVQPLNFSKLSAQSVYSAGAGLSLSSLVFSLDTNHANLWTANQTFGTSTQTAFQAMSSGSVLFAGANGVLSQNNSNFFWDNTNHRLGIGTSTLTDALVVVEGPFVMRAGTDEGLQVTTNGTTSWTNLGTTNGIIPILSWYRAGSTTPSGTITANGSVGIGTSTPNNLLQVVDLINFDNTGENTKLGYQAGKNIVAGAGGNVFVGYQAGLSSSTGSTGGADDNSAFGYQSFFSNTTGTENVALGDQSLYSNTTGRYNTASGYTSLYSNTTGQENTANGMESLSNNTTGSYNVASGLDALLNNTTGNNNTAFGYLSLVNSTIGSNNIGIGYYAGAYEDNSTSNVLYIDNLNRGSLSNGKSQSLIYGVSSTTLSAQKLVFNANVGIGTTTPSVPLVVVGSTTITSLNNAGFVKSTATGALYNDVTTYLSLASATSTYVPFTYASSTFPSFTYSSSTFPSFSYASSTFPSFTYASSTFVSFTYASTTFPSFAYGTSTYQTKLTNPVTGTGATNTLAYWTSTSQVSTLATGTAGTFLRASSTSATGFDWSPAGTGSVTAVTVTTANGVSATVANQGTTPALTFTLGAITPSTVNGLTLATTTTGFTISTTSQALSVIGSSTISGSFIGSSSGTNTGDVTLANIINGLTISGQVLTMGLASSTATGTLSASDWTTFNNKQGPLSGIAGLVARFTAASTLGTGVLIDNGTVAGVNATSSTTTFNVQGSGTLNPFNVSSSTGASYVTVQSNGNVGIGTSTPSAQFTIVDQNNSGLRLEAYNATAGVNIRAFTGTGTAALPGAIATNTTMLAMTASGYDGSASGFGTAAAQIAYLSAESFTPTAHGSYMTFSTVATGTTARFERMRIDQSGKVGIGTFTPNALLSVSTNMSSANGAIARVTNLRTTDDTNSTALSIRLGVASSTSNGRFIQFYSDATNDNNGTGVGNISVNAGGVAYNTGSADFGEYFNKGDDNLEQGDIVTLDSNGMANYAAQNDKVIGIISKTAGFVGGVRGEASTSRIIVGLIGQLPAKVSLENGEINSGDLLTMSSTNGVAMKSTKDGDQTVGIALESLSSCSGVCKISIFVNVGYSNVNPVSAGLSPDWSVDSNTGMLKSAYALDLNDKDIANIHILQAVKVVTNELELNGYCITIENGLLKATLGSCDSGSSTDTTTNTSDEGLTGDSSTDSTSTTTDTTSDDDTSSTTTDSGMDSPITI